MKEYDLIIIGSGPAGLGAAVEAYDSGVRNILVIERDRELGGILQQCIHNGFGLHEFKEDLTGPEYAQRFIDGLQERKIEYLLDTMVLDVDMKKKVHTVSEQHGYRILKAKAVILAMGCRERPRGALSIPGTRPAGVLTAGAAQRYINMEGYMVGKRVVILGSGDIGLIMARRLTLEGAKVLAVVELMPYSSGLTRNIVQCLDDYGIPLYLSHTVTKVEGKHRVEGVTVSAVAQGAGDGHPHAGDRHPVPGTEVHFECDTLLLSVGLIPENELTERLGADLDRATKGPVVDNRMETTVPGIFACGNVVHVHDLVDLVTEESRKAARGAAAYIRDIDSRKNKPEQIYITTEVGSGVGYVVPQRIKTSESPADTQVNCFFRVKSVYKDSELVVRCGQREIRRIKKRIMTPGEMEHVTIELSDPENIDRLTFEVEAAE